jgi:hypothetical protein
MPMNTPAQALCSLTLQHMYISHAPACIAGAAVHLHISLCSELCSYDCCITQRTMNCC